MLERFLKDEPLQSLQSVCTCEEIVQARQALSSCDVSEDLRLYITRLCSQTRRDPRCLTGVSPRGMIRLMRACQSLALTEGRSYVIPDDVQRLAIPVLAHRIIPRGYTGRAETAEAVVRDAVKATPVPTEER